MQFQFNISQILKDTGHNYINKFAGLKGSIWNGFDLLMDTSLQIDSLSWALQLQRFLAGQVLDSVQW